MLRELNRTPYREPGHAEKIEKIAIEFPFSISQVRWAYEKLHQDEALTRAVLKLCIASGRADLDAIVSLISARIRESD
jgi:hypothetical protein